MEHAVPAGTPLAGATLKELDVTGTYDNKKTGFDDATSTLRLYFKDATSISAGVPYIIKWPDGDDIVNPLFMGVTVSNADPTTVQSVDEKVRFAGHYVPTAFDAENQNILFLGADNKLYYPQSGARINACRAYFELADVNAPVMNNHLNFGDGETTEIKTTNYTNHTNSNVWYDLSGRKLDQQPTKKGVYIHEGRKVVIK